jgi:hypothetical protein
VAEQRYRLVAPGLALIAQSPAPPASGTNIKGWHIEPGRTSIAPTTSQKHSSPPPYRVRHNLRLEPPDLRSTSHGQGQFHVVTRTELLTIAEQFVVHKFRRDDSRALTDSYAPRSPSAA